MTERYAIYYVNDSFYAVDNGMDMRILEMLSEREMSITEIAEAMGCSSSSVTHHLRKLKDGGLLSSRISLTDARSVIYSMNDCDIVAVNREPDHIRESMESMADAVVSKRVPLVEGVFKMFMFGLEGLSVDVTPSMDIIARKIGKEMAKNTPKGDFFSLLMSMKEFLEKSVVEEMRFSVSDTVLIDITDSMMKDPNDMELMKEFVSNMAAGALEYCSDTDMDYEISSESDGCRIRYSFRGDRDV